jgi:hypothetical protein
VIGSVAWVAWMVAIAPNERIDLDLVGGDTVSGRVARIQSDGIDVATTEGRQFVPLSLVETAQIEGRDLHVDALRLEMDLRLSLELRRLPLEGKVVNPFLVTTASFLMPGAGEAILGDWADAKALFAADLVVLSLGSYLWFVQDDRPAAVPLFGLDLIFRLMSASTVHSNSRRRRALSRESEAIRARNFQ